MKLFNTLKNLFPLISLLAFHVHSQIPISCNIQFTAAGAYTLQAGTPPSLTTTTGTLTSTPIALSSNCGSVSYNSTSNLYTWTPSVSLSVQYLLVAGGGAGGQSWGGGGGGGGLLSGAFTVTQNTLYDFAVGLGGRGSVVNLETGNSGGDTTGFGLTAFGGGGGGGGNAYLGNNGINGGSGGGGGEFVTGGGTLSTAPGNGTVGQGFSGGRQIRGSNPWSTAGGGGGAGSAGTDGIGSSGGTGGSGLVSGITGTSVTYSAGGGGAGYTTYGIASGLGGSNGSGGSGGAGSGATNQGEIGGSATTPGSGGGGGSGNNGPSGPGSNGTVVIAFLTTAPYSPNSNNTFVGNQAGAGNTSAFNTFLGANAGQFDINGHGNMYVGFNSGPTANSTHPSYYSIIALGSNALVPNTLTQNAIAIGSSSMASTNQIKLGDTNLTTFRVGRVAQWPTPSDRHLKTHIEPSQRGLSFIKRLKPVLYEFKSNGVTQLGFIAQDVEQVDSTFPGLVKPQNESDYYALNYEAFLPAIVSSVQEIDSRVKELDHNTTSGLEDPPSNLKGHLPPTGIGTTSILLDKNLFEDPETLLVMIATVFYLIFLCILVFTGLQLRLARRL